LGRAADGNAAASRADAAAAEKGTVDPAADAEPEAAAADSPLPLQASASNPKRASAGATPKKVTPRITLALLCRILARQIDHRAAVLPPKRLTVTGWTVTKWTLGSPIDAPGALVAVVTAPKGC
jgi:hypothetical protein